jgi:hypothetical protein
MNFRASVQKASRWVLLLYLAVMAVTGVAHSCVKTSVGSTDSHAAIAAHTHGFGSQGCPTCDLHRATVSALVVTSGSTVLLPRQASAIGDIAVSTPSSRALTQLSRGPPAA